MAKHNATIADHVASYGEHKFNVADLPLQSIAYLLDRGLAHYLGNQVASKVTAAKAKAEKDGTAWNDAETAVALNDFRQEAIDKLLAGDVGTGAASPRGDRVMQEMRRIAEGKVKELIRKKGKTVASVDNLGDLVKSFVDKYESALRPQAEKNLAEAAAMAEDMDLDI